jgi:hypothetical protein
VAVFTPGTEPCSGSRHPTAIFLADFDGIYLSHMLFIIMLTRVGWGKLTSVIPWPALCLVPWRSSSPSAWR